MVVGGAVIGALRLSDEQVVLWGGDEWDGRCKCGIW